MKDFTPKLGQRILCKVKHEKNERGTFGCFKCGGYGWLVEWVTVCVNCGKQAWVSNHERGITIFDGKELYSWDGVKRIWHPGGELCSDCDRGKRAA